MTKAKDIKTLKDFSKLRTVMTIKEYDDEFGYYSFEDDPEGFATVESITSYNGMFISNMNDGTFFLEYERDEYTCKTIEQAEKLLWDGFAKWEFSDESDREDDLQERAKEWLDENGFDVSLDEIPQSELKESQKNEVNYLLNQFENLR